MSYQVETGECYKRDGSYFNSETKSNFDIVEILPLEKPAKKAKPAQALTAKDKATIRKAIKLLEGLV